MSNSSSRHVFWINYNISTSSEVHSASRTVQKDVLDIFLHFWFGLMRNSLFVYLVLMGRIMTVMKKDDICNIAMELKQSALFWYRRFLVRLVRVMIDEVAKTPRNLPGMTLRPKLR